MTRRDGGLFRAAIAIPEGASMSISTCLLVMLGGAAGTLLRYLISVWMTGASQQLPWGTIAINVAGSFVIGFFGTLTLASGRFPVSENVRLLVMVGVCGGFTTFSSLQFADVRPVFGMVLWSGRR